MTLFPGLALPLIVAPMFLISSPAMVIAAGRAGALGTFPALNQRTSDGFERWVAEIAAGLRDPAAPFGVNLVTHATNGRLEPDLEICVRQRVPLVITSLGVRRDVVERVQAYGGRVLHDVTTVRHARKAAAAGVDGLILVGAGAGGHAGTLSPFALLAEVRNFFRGTIVLAGAISDGRGMAAARVMGADLVYMGTRFLAARESQAPDDLKRMVCGADAGDVLYTSGISGIPGNFLVPSIRAAGFDPGALADGAGYRARTADGAERVGKAWKDIWSAGQGVGAVGCSEAVGDIVATIAAEYRQALASAPDLLPTARATTVATV